MATAPDILGLGLEDVIPTGRSLLTVKQLAGILAVSEKTVYAWVAEGAVPYIKLGSAVRFRPAAIREWLGRREFRPPELQRDGRRRGG